MATAAAKSGSRFIVAHWPMKNKIFYGLSGINRV
jgi:hypothetical protein